MINLQEELDIIFADPIFDDVKPQMKKTTSSDRLIAGFLNIVEFVESHKRLPQKVDGHEERKLYNQLQGILKDPDKKARCLPYDTVGVLAEKEDSLEDILNDPIFADVSDGAGLFDLPDYMKKRLEERCEADYVARHVKCEEFDEFELGFKEVHTGLKTGKYRLIKFKEAHIAQGRYFIEDGMLVYIASLDQIEKNRHGKKNSRTRCIYENGMESDVYMQTLCKNLYSNGYSVQDISNISDAEFKEQFAVDSGDVESGIIYVLRSLSDNPEISSIKNLYKIGFTTVSLESRLSNAKNEPTYLYADVEVVAQWRVYNVKSSVFENLIHKLFDSVQLQITIDNKQPKEWFVVPIKIIEQAILYIIRGKTVAYDKNIEQLIDYSD